MFPHEGAFACTLLLKSLETLIEFHVDPRETLSTITFNRQDRRDANFSYDQTKKIYLIIN